MKTLNKSKEKLIEYLKTLAVFAKWLALSSAAGIVVGGAGTLFHFAVEYATSLRESNGWLIYFLPLGGVIIVFLYRGLKMEHDKGTNQVFISVRSGENVPIKMAPLIFVSTVLTHLFGGSSGREGAAIQLGGSLAGGLGRLFRLDEKDLRIMIMCGMSAAFSALFRTPVAAAVFSIEVISVGVMYYAALVPCVVGSVIGYYIGGLFGVAGPQMGVMVTPKADISVMVKTAALALLCAVVSTVFCKIMRQSYILYDKYIKNPYLRAMCGGAIVVAAALLLGSTDYLGAGMDVVRRAVAGQAVPYAFLCKMLLTAVTLGAGFKGGEIVPTLFIGATFGNVMGALLGLPPSFGACIGMVALFCGVTNCPLTALFIGLEMFGMSGIVFFTVACAVSYMMSGYNGLYSAQKIVYSKYRPEFINRDIAR